MRMNLTHLPCIRINSALVAWFNAIFAPWHPFKESYGLPVCTFITKGSKWKHQWASLSPNVCHGSCGPTSCSVSCCYLASVGCWRFILLIRNSLDPAAEMQQDTRQATCLHMIYDFLTSSPLFIYIFTLKWKHTHLFVEDETSLCAHDLRYQCICQTVRLQDGDLKIK